MITFFQLAPSLDVSFPICLSQYSTAGSALIGLLRLAHVFIFCYFIFMFTCGFVPACVGGVFILSRSDPELVTESQSGSCC